MMLNIFDNAKQWTVESKDFIGLPRPFYTTPKDFYDKKHFSFKTNMKFFMHKIVPIPWQSFPFFIEGGGLGLIQKNESRVYIEKLCPYCGKHIQDEEIVIRWKNHDKIPTLDGPRVWSDYHPFHIECMKQGRKYCPFMRSTKNKEFETGQYKELLQNAIDYHDSIINK